MPAFNMFTEISCTDFSAVFYKAERSNLSPMAFKIGFTSAMIPHGYHVVAYSCEDFNEGANCSDPIEVPLFGKGQSCIDLENFSDQPKSFCYCKNCDEYNVLFGPEHCLCPECPVNCNVYPDSENCKPDPCDG